MTHLRLVTIRTTATATIEERWQVAVGDDITDEEALEAAFEGRGEVVGVETEVTGERDREVVSVEPD